jgi:predicted site-specific integrase-resolvase
MLVSIGKATKEAGVHVDTIRNWERKGYIKSERTHSNRKQFDLEAVMSYANATKLKPQQKVTAIYARVSTPSRKSDLEFQKKVLQLHCASKGWEYVLVEDIGSGLNFKKKGLLQLINLIENNKIERILLNYKDRLLVFSVCSYVFICFSNQKMLNIILIIY